MLNRWLIVALAGLPVGMAVAEHAHSSSSAEVASDSLAEPMQLAESGLERTREALRALMLAHRNAYNDGDMMLATCLQALIEQVEKLVPEAAAHVDTAEGIASGADPSALRAALAATGKKLDVLLDHAAACVGEEGSSEGITKVEVSLDDSDTETDGPDLGPTGVPSVDAPVMPPIADGPGTVTTFDPADDMPMVPNTASPMR